MIDAPKKVRPSFPRVISSLSTGSVLIPSPWPCRRRTTKRRRRRELPTHPPIRSSSMFPLQLSPRPVPLPHRTRTFRKEKRVEERRPRSLKWRWTSWIERWLRSGRSEWWLRSLSVGGIHRASWEADSVCLMVQVRRGRSCAGWIELEGQRRLGRPDVFCWTCSQVCSILPETVMDDKD
jgi:hypothetical protein